MQDRIKAFRRVAGKELKVNPKNWRTHSVEQSKLLKGVLQEIGYADALLARELPDGSLELIDGHLRAKTTPNQKVPVLVLDVNEAEADILLATLDPLSALAGTDEELFRQLTAQIETENSALQEFLDKTGAVSEISDAEGIKELTLPDVLQIVVTCGSEAEQKELYERLTSEGQKCRIVNL